MSNQIALNQSELKELHERLKNLTEINQGLSKMLAQDQNQNGGNQQQL